MLSEETIGNIADLVNKTNLKKNRNGIENSGDNEVRGYIVGNLVPNLKKLYNDIQDKIEVSESEVKKQEIIYLKEERFVETIKLLTHPEIAKRLDLMQQIFNEDENSPVVMGFTIVGSAAFGGLLVREAVGEASGPWVDVDLMASYVLKDDGDPNKIANYFLNTAKPQLKRQFNSGMIKSPGSKNYELCDAHNIGTMNFAVIQSEEEAMNLLIAVENNQVDESMVYQQFFPSYPAYLNALGRYYILESLSNLAKNNPEKWKAITEKISLSLKTNIQFLKPKHFGKDRDDDISQKLDKINEFIASLFTDLIKATKNAI